MIRPRLVLTSLLAFAPTIAPRAARSEPAPAPVEWTILVYHGADCDLEAPMMDDLEEMAAGAGPGIRILALVDRSPAGEPEGSYTNRDVGGLKAWHGAKLVEVVRGGLRELETLPGTTNLGDPATLAAFVEQGRARAPAKRTALLLGDHGAGWPGICTDDSHDHDLLTLPELRDALERTAGEGQRLALIGFDACLMANLEVAAAMAPFAEVMVGSEELEPGSGWWYTPVLEALAKAPTTGPAGLGTAIADRFLASFSAQPGVKDADRGRDVTLSVTDLSKLDEVLDAFEGFAQAAKGVLGSGGKETWVPLARARARAEEYGRSAKPGEAGFELFDLGDLVANAAAAVPALAEPAAKVKAALAAAIVHAVRGALRPASSGLSVWFPRERSDGAAAAYAAAFPAGEGAWSELLAEFGRDASADTGAPQVEPPVAPEHAVDPEHGVTVEAKLAAVDDVERASFVLARKEGDAVTIVGAIPIDPTEDGTLKETWHGGWFTLEDGTERLLCAIADVDEVDEEADTFLAGVPAVLRRKGSETWSEVTLTFFVDVAEDGVSGRFLHATTFGRFGPRRIELRPGDALRAARLVVAADGSATQVVDEDDPILVVDDEDALAVGYDAVPAGEWLVGYWVEDLAGNSALTVVPVTTK